MSEFWSRALGTAPAPQQEAPASRAWWQSDDPYANMRPVELAPGYNPNPVNYGEQQQQVNTERYVKQRRKMGHQNISWEDAELIAEYDLATKAKYQNECPQCGSGNYLPAGTKMGSTIMPTEKCFDCGLSARGPEPALGGRGGAGPSSLTRQIDTGGAGGQSMFRVFRGVPQSYMPRA